MGVPPCETAPGELRPAKQAEVKPGQVEDLTVGFQQGGGGGHTVPATPCKEAWPSSPQGGPQRLPKAHMDRQTVKSISAVRGINEAEQKREAALARRHERKVNSSDSLAFTLPSRSSVGSLETLALSVWQLRVQHMISSWKFDAAIGVCICFNALTIGVETTYSAKETAIPLWVQIVEPLLLSVYTVELALRVYVYKMHTFSSKWVRFDLLLVCCGLLDLMVKAALSSETPDALANIMLVRMLRLARLARAARLLIQFKVLWLLVQGLMNSFLTILWTFVIIFVLIYIFAIVGMEILRPDEDAGEAYQEAATNFNEGLGKSMLVLVQFLTLDSIGSIYIPICMAKPFLTVYFVTFILVVSVAMMNLVTALMVDNAMKQSTQDREAEKAWQAANKKKALPRLKAMFEDLDIDNSGCLDFDEIEHAPEALKEQLQQIANMEDCEELFHMLDFDGSGTVEVDEFCDGIMKVAQDKKPFELLRLMRQCGAIQKSSQLTLQAVERLERAGASLPEASVRPGTGGGGSSSHGSRSSSSVGRPGDAAVAATPLLSAEAGEGGSSLRAVAGGPVARGTPMQSTAVVEERLAGMERRIARIEANVQRVADAAIEGRLSSLEQRFTGFEASLQQIAVAVGVLQ